VKKIFALYTAETGDKVTLDEMKHLVGNALRAHSEDLVKDRNFRGERARHYSADGCRDRRPDDRKLQEGRHQALEARSRIKIIRMNTAPTSRFPQSRV